MQVDVSQKQHPGKISKSGKEFENRPQKDLKLNIRLSLLQGFRNVGQQVVFAKNIQVKTYHKPLWEEIVIVFETSFSVQMHWTSKGGPSHMKNVQLVTSR